jgi:putative flippase GtrA
LSPQRHRRPIRFLVVGVWNTLVGYGSFYGLYFLLTPHGVHYLVVLTLAQIVSVTNGYLCQRIFVFGSAERLFRAFFKFTLVYWITFAINAAALPLLVNLAGVSPLAAQTGLIAVSTIGSYFAHARFSFRPSDARRSPAREESSAT